MNGAVWGGAKVWGDGSWDCGVGEWGRKAASPDASGASRGDGGADHAAGFSALAMSWNSALRARWTSWAASRLVVL